MSKKLWIGLAILVIGIFSCSLCLANNDQNPLQGAANAARNVVGGAENAVEGAANGVTGTMRGATNNIEHNGENTMNHVGATTRNAGTHDYTAQRTNAETRFMGMSSTMWTWLIIGIAAIAIIALVWYYSMQVTGNRNNNLD